MKRHRGRTQRNHSTPRPPQLLPGLGSRLLGEGRRLMELSPAASAWLERGARGFSLQAFVCFPVVPSALSAPRVSSVLN